MYPFYLGIDLHLKRTYLVLMNHDGGIIEEQPPARIFHLKIHPYLTIQSVGYQRAIPKGNPVSRAGLSFS